MDEGGGGDEYASMDTADISVPQHGPQWMRSSTAADGSAWSHRAWKRGRFYGVPEGGIQGRHLVAEEATADQEQAAQLQAQHQDAAAAAAAAAEAAAAAAAANILDEAPPADGIASLALERRKQELWDAAQEEGVEVSCETIANMSSEELEQWAKENIAGL